MNVTFSEKRDGYAAFSLAFCLDVGICARGVRWRLHGAQNLVEVPGIFKVPDT
jgi:hypothetical protein